MKDIYNRFKDKINLKNNNIYYIYNGQILKDEELKLEEIVNIEDKKRKKMNIIIYTDIIRLKNIICPECKENIRMNINEYKIDLYGCKNGHNIKNIV